jgi:formate-nitrite transporter family protein
VIAQSRDVATSPSILNCRFTRSVNVKQEGAADVVSILLSGSANLKPETGELSRKKRGDQQKDEERTFSPADKLEGLSHQQKEEVESQSRPNAALIHETIRAEGESELERTASALVLSGLAAGLSMGFSLIVQGELHANLPPGSARVLLSPLGYTVGFVIVVLGRQQLFTENTLTPILPLLHNRDLSTLARVVRLWALVLTSNIVGTWLIAAAIAHTSLFEPNVINALAEVSRSTLHGSFNEIFVRGIFAGWLIAMMVWLLPASEGSRPFIISIITYVVALGGFSHIIAGSVEGAFLIHVGEASLGDYFAFFIPTLLGNILGGVALVAALNYGQVVPEIKPSK